MHYVRRMAKTYTPNELAIGLFGERHAFAGGKRIRAFLRANGYRNMAKDRGKTWQLDAKTAAIVRKAFEPVKPKATRKRTPKAAASVTTVAAPVTPSDPLDA